MNQPIFNGITKLYSNEKFGFADTVFCLPQIFACFPCLLDNLIKFCKFNWNPYLFIFLKLSLERLIWKKKKLNFFIWKLEFFEIFDLLKLSMLKINSSQVSETFLYMLEIHTIFLSDFVEKIKEFVERKQRLLIRR